MKIEVDISGQIQQLNYDSVIGAKGKNFLRSVFLKSDVKKEIIRKYKGQVTNLIEKIHAIMIYYCLKDFLSEINEIEICRDGNFRKVKNLLLLLFRNNLVKIKQRDSYGPKSGAHVIANKTFRNRKYSNELIKKEMIEDVLFKFKK